MITGVGGGGGFKTQDLEAMRQRRFNRIDQDGDGKLTQDEMKAVLPKGGNGPDVEAIFAKVDTNQDGAIDQSEDKVAFQSMKGARPGPPPGPPLDPSKLAAELFKTADTDSDGKVTKDELATALQKAIDKSRKSIDIEALFQKIDTDDDGGITQAELAKAFEKLQKSGGGHHHGRPAASYGAGMEPRGTPPPTDTQLSAVA